MKIRNTWEYAALNKQAGEGWGDPLYSTHFFSKSKDEKVAVVRMATFPLTPNFNCVISVEDKGLQPTPTKWQSEDSHRFHIN